jgi:hypothetical protein
MSISGTSGSSKSRFLLRILVFLIGKSVFLTEMGVFGVF